MVEGRSAGRTASLDEGLLEDVVRSLPVGIIVVDDEGRVVLCNERANAIRGVGRRLGKPVAECHPVRSRPALEALLERFRTEPSGEGHPLVVERGGRWEITYARVLSREGSYRGAVWLAHDITRQKELQRQLLHQQRISGLGRMAARLAHDVNNPLNIVTGAVHNLRASAGDDGTREMLAIVEEQVSRLQDLVGRLRDATRPLRPRMVDVDVRSLVLDAAYAARRTGPARVTADVPDDLPSVHADPDLLRRLLGNALDNAVRAAGPLGQVRLAAEFESRSEGERLTLAVEDDGPGFPAEVLDNLFEPFVTTRPDGIGLGLPIMKEICVLHGGDVKVENLPAGGARVAAWVRPR
jgi:PAS domain S-box-containing protein